MSEKKINIRSAAFFATLTAFISVSNDVVTKFIDADLPSIQVAFLRFAFSFLSLCPFWPKYRVCRAQNLMHQVMRGVVGSAALALFVYALHLLPLPEVTILSLTQVLFVLPMSAIFLKDKIKKSLVIAVIIGFIGVIIFLNAPELSSTRILGYSTLLLSSILFAGLDLMAKNLVNKSSTFSMLWYFSFVTTVISAPFAIYQWQPISMRCLILVGALGVGGNLIQIALFAALRRASAGFVSPFRYLEIVFSWLVGMLIFDEILSFNEIIGALIIVLATYYISKNDTA